MALNHTGTHTIETERLTLRRFEKSDAPMMFQNWGSDPEVTKYLTWTPHENIGETESLLSRWIPDYERPDFYFWAISLKATQQTVGSIDLRVTDRDDNCCEIGYCLSRACWNKGLMTEAVRAVLAFGFETLRCERIEAIHDAGNDASGRVAQKAGMRHEGTLRSYDVRNDGSRTDSEMYGIVEGDPRP